MRANDQSSEAREPFALPSREPQLEDGDGDGFAASAAIRWFLTADDNNVESHHTAANLLSQRRAYESPDEDIQPILLLCNQLSKSAAFDSDSAECCCRSDESFLAHMPSAPAFVVEREAEREIDFQPHDCNSLLKTLSSSCFSTSATFSAQANARRSKEIGPFFSDGMGTELFKRKPEATDSLQNFQAVQEQLRMNSGGTNPLANNWSSRHSLPLDTGEPKQAMLVMKCSKCSSVSCRRSISTQTTEPPLEPDFLLTADYSVANAQSTSATSPRTFPNFALHSSCPSIFDSKLVCRSPESLVSSDKQELSDSYLTFAAPTQSHESVQDLLAEAFVRVSPKSAEPTDFAMPAAASTQDIALKSKRQRKRKKHCSGFAMHHYIIRVQCTNTEFDLELTAKVLSSVAKLVRVVKDKAPNIHVLFLTCGLDTIAFLKHYGLKTKITLVINNDCVLINGVENKHSTYYSLACEYSHKYTARFEISIDSKHSFNVRSKILGVKGHNMKEIFLRTKSRLRLRGRGSGYLEGVNQQEADENLHLCVSNTDLYLYILSKQMTIALIKQVYSEYFRYCVARKLTPVVHEVVFSEDFKSIDPHRA